MKGRGGPTGSDVTYNNEHAPPTMLEGPGYEARITD